MENRIEKIKQAFATFHDKMKTIRKQQLALFDRIDRVVSRTKADEVRNKINNN